MVKPLWTPDADAVEESNLNEFKNFVRSGSNRAVDDWPSLYRFSIDEPERFWPALWSFCEIRGEMGDPPYLIDGDQMPGARFFPDARLNFAENLLEGDGPDVALVFWGEDQVKRRMTRANLKALVSRWQQALKDRGVEAGDRVAGIMPNMPETIAAMLAATSLGAVWSSCSPDFGEQGILDRFSQIEPKAVIACDGYYYNGKPFDIGAKLQAVLGALSSVKQTIIVPYLDRAGEIAGELAGAITLDEAIAPYEPGPIEYAALPFSHPLYILYSSGTTGVPKCIVHSAGGTLLQHVKEQRLHCNLKPGDHLFYFTTTGWMMWNWLVSGLASGLTLMLYDGSPFWPSGNILFDMADAERFTMFGTSAKFIDALKKSGLRPRDSHDLSSIKLIGSTGSPLAPESFDFVYDGIKSDVHLASVSGGTDIIACFVIGNPLLPVWRGEIQSPALGMATAVFDEDGRPLSSGKGELVCTKSFPSMPIGFWNDASGEKYHDAYFARFENVWHHGDFAEWTEHGGMIIHGRSDATLNPGGVRIGTAEIYRQVEQLDEVKESIVIGQSTGHDVRVVLFVVLDDDATLDEALKDRIVRKIRAGASPRHVPERIVEVPDIPRTKSGKITELAVRDVVHGRAVKNTEALANPEALEHFRDRSELAL